MNERTPKLDPAHIILEPVEASRIRGVGMAITSPIAKPIDKSGFINKVNSAIDGYSIKLLTKTQTYFLIDLTMPHYSSSVSAMMKKLKLNLKSVIDDYKILVATEDQNLKEYLRLDIIHKGVLNVIKDIRKLDSAMKIGQSLQKLIREDVDKKKSFSILIRLIEYLDNEEKSSCLKSLHEILSSEQSITVNPESLTVACNSSSSAIQNVAELPFVKIITESPKVQRKIEKSSSECITIIPHEKIKFEEGSNLLPPICIIDSGISPVLNQFVLKNDPFNFVNLTETIPHGTAIASIAIFGEDLIERKKTLESKTKVISVKIDDDSIPDTKIMIEEAIMYAVKKYKHLTPIFNVSYNYFEIAHEQRIEMLKRLDTFIQRENVIVVNSAGNIFQNQAYYLRKEYPEYITKNPVFAPADSRNIFSVGSICFVSKLDKIIYSRHTRIGIHPSLQNEELDKYNFFKPEIHTFGGNTIPDDKTGLNVVSNDLGFPVISQSGDLYLDCGTSFSAPLISLCFARLYAQYSKVLNNSETYKAILLNKCINADCSGMTTFSLINTKNVAKCDDAVYVNFEGESEPHEKAENQKRKKVIKCKKIQFHMPSEAESLDVVVVHSNNYPHQTIKEYNTKLVLKFKKPSGTICKKTYGNIGRKSCIAFAKYDFKKTYSGQWEVELHIETSGIPGELFNETRIRFGVSLKINIKSEFKEDLTRIYEEVSNKTKSKILNPQEHNSVIIESDKSKIHIAST